MVFRLQYRTRAMVVVIGAVQLFLLPVVCRAFVSPSATTNAVTTSTIRHNNLDPREEGRGQSTVSSRRRRNSSSSSTSLFSGYFPPADAENLSSATSTKKKKSLHPSIGDFVRYYDLDGGLADGEVLVGKISFIQKNLSREKSWLVEINELEDVGDGYYAEYPQRKRASKKTMRQLEDVVPVMGSFVRSENAFRVPATVRAERYDIDDYEGPFSGDNEINQETLASDMETYSAIKGTLLKYSALAGLAGTLLTNLVKGSEDAAIYAAGAVASLFYLFFLSLKTDTLGKPDSKLGANVSNLRFAMPVLVVVGIALYNQSLGDANPVRGSGNPFDRVTPEQFASAILGFLTYRLPLFFSQLQEAFKDENDELVLPGSAGVAMQLAKGGNDDEAATIGGAMSGADLKTVLVVSGPQATGRSELVRRLIAEGDGRFVEPTYLDSIKDGATFERLYQRDEFLTLDLTERYGLTAEGILDATAASSNNIDGDIGTKKEEKVVVLDADIELVKKVTRISGLRLVGVWVGLASVEDFERRLDVLVDNGTIPVPEDETKESVIRAKIREIVREIEYGITSGVFEFTILNEEGENGSDGSDGSGDEESYRQLKNAAEYCFR